MSRKFPILKVSVELLNSRNRFGGTFVWLSARDSRLTLLLECRLSKVGIGSKDIGTGDLFLAGGDGRVSLWSLESE